MKDEPAALSVGGLAAGIGAVQLWSLKLIPLFFALSLFFILRTHWLIFFKRQGNLPSVVITGSVQLLPECFGISGSGLYR
ncbi:hypothetical protein IID62_03330 [candidate division KSB1 bacterium]|nr:hypothetical protein [candidate division KSB1 bacterium]